MRAPRIWIVRIDNVWDRMKANVLLYAAPEAQRKAGQRAAPRVLESPILAARASYPGAIAGVTAYNSRPTFGRRTWHEDSRSKHGKGHQ